MARNFSGNLFWQIAEISFLAVWQECVIMIFIAKWLIQTNRVRLSEELMHCCLTIIGLLLFHSLAFPTNSATYKGLSSLLLVDLLMLACSLWPRTQSYCSNAETENRPPKICYSKILTMISTSVFTATAYMMLFGLPLAASRSSSTSSVQNSLET